MKPRRGTPRLFKSSHAAVKPRRAAALRAPGSRLSLLLLLLQLLLVFILWVYIYIYIYIYTCVRVCVYIYIYIYMYTHIQQQLSILLLLLLLLPLLLLIIIHSHTNNNFTYSPGSRRTTRELAHIFCFRLVHTWFETNSRRACKHIIHFHFDVEM